MAPDPNPANPPHRWELWAQLLVVAGFTALLCSRLDQPFWLDEAWVVHRVLGTPTTYLDVQLLERGFEFLLGSWGSVFGKSVTTLRLMVVLPALASVWFVMRSAGRARGDPITAGLVFTSFSAVCHYSLELNRYAETMLGASLVLWALLELRDQPKAKYYVILGLAGVGSFYIHHTTALTIVSVSSVALAAQWWTSTPEHRRARLTAMGVVPACQLLALLPEVALVLTRLETYQAEQESVYSHVYRGPSPEALLQILGDLGPGDGTHLALRVLATACVLLAVVWGLRGGRPAQLVGILALGPFVGAAIGSLVQPMFLTRIVLPAAPALAVLASRPGSSRRPLLRVCAVLLALYSWSAFWHKPWPEDPSGVFQSIEREWQPGDALVAHPPFALIVLKGNELAGVGRLPPMQALHIDAATELRAAGPDYAGYPPRTFFVLYHFKGYSERLAQELPHHFQSIEHLGTYPGFQLLLAKNPLERAEALAASRKPHQEPPALSAYREGVILLHAGQPQQALQAFNRARATLPTGLARDDREATDDKAQVAWAVAWSAHLSHQPALAREALLEAEAHGSQVSPEARQAILGE